VKKSVAQKLRQRKRKIRTRLDKRSQPQHLGPMLNPGAIDYELSDRNRGILYGGMGAVQLLVKRLELDKAINQRLHLFKLHNPYYESDHVLNIAYNILCNGECLEDKDVANHLAGISKRSKPSINLFGKRVWRD